MSASERVFFQCTSAYFVGLQFLLDTGSEPRLAALETLLLIEKLINR